MLYPLQFVGMQARPVKRRIRMSSRSSPLDLAVAGVEVATSRGNPLVVVEEVAGAEADVLQKQR